ncbi:hypothetical protein [Candidatus Cyanaurora vandensis]|uniref:hypothetical protein n=1 Tax=Candidatus Cyanaurora vandensis TaxID=2714958 RepID=UPI00257C8255|nr:hypothetical protein [Candidatus Cyanaurora vandensis]
MNHQEFTARLQRLSLTPIEIFQTMAQAGYFGSALDLSTSLGYPCIACSFEDAQGVGCTAQEPTLRQAMTTCALKILARPQPAQGTCQSCGFYYGCHGLVCAVHPSGPLNDRCLDWAAKPALS